MKFDCENCGKIDEALMDGYAFGDGTLEGVKFRVKKSDEGTYEITPVDNWESDPYLVGLNKDHWLQIAKEYAEDNDIFECPTCHQDVVPDDMLL